MPPFARTANTGGGYPYARPEADPVAPKRLAIEEVIRETTAMDRWLPAPSRIRTLSGRLRAYITVTASAVEAAVSDRPLDDPIRKDALAVVKEARHRLGLGVGDGYASAITCARSLGRGAEALLQQWQVVRHSEAATTVAVAGAAGAGVIVVGPGERCAVCLGLTRERQESELRRGWGAVKTVDSRLAAHRRTAHTAAS